jgi:hypothetical protein
MTQLEIILIGSLLSALGLGGWLLYHDHVEITKGESRIEAKDKELADAQQKHALELVTMAKEASDQAVAQYKATVAAPDTGAPVVRLCRQAVPSASTVRPDAGAGPHPDDKAGQPSVVSGPDIGRDIDERFRDDDALIIALQTYIATCQAQGFCAK